MFTGIIETVAEIGALKAEGTNLTFTLQTPLAAELKTDQSVAHNGACLTVTEAWATGYTVTAIQETLQKTSLGQWKPGTLVNLERCMAANGRFDGHIVQGHVDQTGICTQITDMDGSWVFSFRYNPAPGNITVEKGSVCINGVSLTVVDSRDDGFSVAIIPYTYAHTNFRQLAVGDQVNLEFDVIGKYLAKIMQKKQ